ANGTPNPQFSSRKVRNHPTGGEFLAARQTDIGRTGYSSQHLLPLVCPLSGGRLRRVTGSPAPAAAVLEPHPPDGARPGGGNCPSIPGNVAAGASLAYYRHSRVFHLRVECLPYSETL